MKLNNWVGMVAAMAVMSAALTGIAEAGEPEHKAAPQHFVCNVGYTMKECNEQMAVLRPLVGKYPKAALGEWTWVLVKSRDWKRMMPMLGLSPDTPAFTCLETRATFIEEALVVRVAERTPELVAKWQMGRESLLEFAVEHEIGHGMCRSLSEDKANRIAAILRRNEPLSCGAGF